MKAKKLFALTAALALLTACSSVKNTVDSTSDGETADTVTDELPNAIPAVDDMSDCYKTEDIKPPAELHWAGAVHSFDDGRILLIGVDENDKDVMYRTNAEFAEFTPFTYDTPDYVSAADRVVPVYYFNRDGSFMALFELQDHGGMRLPEKFDESFDYDAFWEGSTSTYKLARYSAEGKLLGDADLSLPDEFFDQNGYLNYISCASDGDGLLFLTLGGMLMKCDIHGNFTTIGTLTSDDGELRYGSLVQDRDGNIVCSAAFESVREDNSCILTRHFYELKNGEISELSLTLSGEFDDTLISGVGKYRFFLSRSDGLYGYTDSGSLESAINWINSNIEQMFITVLGETEFIAWEPQAKRYYRLTPRDPAEYADATIITIASPSLHAFSEVGTDNMPDMINKFNRSHDDVILRIMTVPDSGDGDDTTAFNMMMLSGTIPDVIYNINYDTFVNYRKKGILADLYGIMDSYGDIKRSDLVENVVKAMEAPDGGLYGICSTFSIGSLVTKASTWDKDSWTLDEFISVHDNAPSNFTHLYDGYTNMEMLHRLSYAMTDLIDWENAECHFDSPDFVKILEFCGRYVNEVVKPDKYYEQEANEAYWEDYYHFLGNDKVISEESGIFDFYYKKYAKGNGADIKFVGFPTNEGNGGIIYPGQLMCITSASQHKEEAWEVIEHFMNYVDPSVYQNWDWYLYTLNDRLGKSLDKMFTNKISYSGWTQPVWDQETRDMMEDYIRSCTKLGTSYESSHCAFDKAVMNIIDEEAMLYFGGDQTAEKAAENVQNRLSILVSERS